MGLTLAIPRDPRVVAVFTVASLLFAATPLANADEIPLFVLAGQSNAVGYASDASELPPDRAEPVPDVSFWYEIGPIQGISNPAQRARSTELAPLRFQSDPDWQSFGPFVDGFGPEVTLGRDLLQLEGRPIALVKFALNGANLAVDWDPSRPDGLYAQMLAVVDTASDAIRARGDTPIPRGFFWMQGESDALDFARANAYEANLTALIARVRSDFGVADLPVVLGRLHAEIGFPFLETVRQAQLAVTGADEAVAALSTDSFELFDDNLHFSAHGQQRLGKRMASRWVDVAFENVPVASAIAQAVLAFVLVLVQPLAVAIRRRRTACIESESER